MTKEEKITTNAIEFAKWLQHLDNGTTHYNPFTKEKTESIGFSPKDCLMNGVYTIEELYEKWQSLQPTVTVEQDGVKDRATIAREFGHYCGMLGVQISKPHIKMVVNFIEEHNKRLLQRVKELEGERRERSSCPSCGSGKLKSRLCPDSWHE